MSKPEKEPARKAPRYGSAVRHNLLGQPVHRSVFLVSATFILMIVAAGAIFPSRLEGFAQIAREAMANHMGWFVLLCMNGFLIFALFIICSRFGRIRLGGEQARPEFSIWGWFAMLFAAGTGVGLLFYGVSEPVSFFARPPFGEPESLQAARDAMVQSIFHWGLHGWAMYALLGLSLGFFAYNRGLPLTVRSGFYPLLGERVHGPVGNAIDIMAVIGTLFGVAVSLGLGVQQINTGLEVAFNWPKSKTIQVVMIASITAVATISVVSGLARGIQKLSKLALLCGGAVAVVVVIAGPTTFIFDALLQNTGAYLQNLPARGTYTEAFVKQRWQNDWTLFYFAWWISWSPFVGMFIARISRGRTVRQYMLGVLLVPVCLSILWLTTVGGSALHDALYSPGELVQAVQSDVAKGMFVFLDSLAMPSLLSVTTVCLMLAAILLFFVTSSDSGSLVIDILTSGGDPDPPTATRVFWACLEGAAAAVLLLAGGLKALQSVATTVGVVFALILIVLCYSLYRGLVEYQQKADEPGTG